MWLILTEPFDPAGAWLASELGAMTTLEVVHLTSRDIADPSRSERGVDDKGVWFRVGTTSGKAIESRKLHGVVNRLSTSPGTLAQAGIGRKLSSEAPALGAPLLRWLHRWPGPVLNRPNVDGLSGDYRPSFWWVDHAVQAGFNMPRPESSPDTRPPEVRLEGSNPVNVAVVGSNVHALDERDGRPVPASLRARCRRLAEAADVSILGVQAIAGHTGDWTFLGASMHPDLMRGGAVVARSMAQALRMGEDRRENGEKSLSYEGVDVIRR